MMFMYILIIYALSSFSGTIMSNTHANPNGSFHGSRLLSVENYDTHDENDSCLYRFCQHRPNTCELLVDISCRTLLKPQNEFHACSISSKVTSRAIPKIVPSLRNSRILDGLIRTTVGMCFREYPLSTALSTIMSAHSALHYLSCIMSSSCICSPANPFSSSTLH